tara:strand:+ start:211 stop:765 length:555 start_codon:yes stop_codon:yes gene_type:complete
MATEAQNIMQAFYSANKREEVKEEEREFKKGALGYMGGVPGALFDIAAGMEAYKTSQALTEGVADMTDTRSKEQKIIDELVEQEDTEKKLKANFKQLAIDNPEKYGPAYNKYINNDLSQMPLGTIATLFSDDLNTLIPGLNLTTQVNDITQGVKLTNVTPDGSVVNYTVGKFEPGQGMLKRFGK